VQSKVEILAASTNAGLLAAALEKMGYDVNVLEGGLRFSLRGRAGSYDSQTGRLDAPATMDTAELKREYSEAVVNATAKKNGWQISWSANAETGNREAEVTRRSY
jgi:monoamine oxidase